jgi:prepilin-type N-terminal cleavage/methylation domain-containing protein
MKKPQQYAGFTLIELLVVIAIIALLLSVLLPGLKKAKDYSKRVICATRLKQIGTAMKMYADANDELLPSGGEDSHGYALYRGDKPEYTDASGKLIPLRLALLYENDYIDVPEIFYCPGNRLALYKYESYTNPTPWGTLPQAYNTLNNSNQWVRMGLTYFPTEREAKINASTGAPGPASKFIRLNTNIPYITDVLHGRSNLSHQNNKIYAVNSLYADVHVSFCNDQNVFGLSVWDRFDNGMSGLSYEEYYYTVFVAIGSR